MVTRRPDRRLSQDLVCIGRMMNPPEIDLIWEGHGTFDVMKFVGRVGGNSSLHYTAGIEHISEIV